MVIFLVLKTNSINDTEYKLSVEVTDDSLFDLQVEKLKQALELILPEEKTLLLLKYQDGVSLKELESIMEISSSAIKMRLKRAKARVIETYNSLP